MTTSTGQEADGFREVFHRSAYPPETSFWDRFDKEPKDSAEAKWLFELGRRASQRHTTFDGWGLMNVRDVSGAGERFNLECTDNLTQVGRIHHPSGLDSGHLRIVHVQLNLDNEKGTSARKKPFATVSREARQQHWQMLKRFTAPLAIEPDFILGHFLPALASDPPISWQGEQLLFIASSPSRQRYVRLKKHDGSKMSVMFRATTYERDGHRYAGRRIILIVEDRLESPIEHPDCFLAQGSDHSIDGLGCIKPYADHVIQSFIQHVQALAIQLHDADALAELEQQATDARERLLYCKRNLIDNSRWLPDLTYALELVDDLRKEISLKKSRQTQDLQLKSAIESDRNAKAANQLAERAGKLGVLAFIFIPLSFVTSLFSMNITPLREPVPLWHFLAVALPFELLTVLLFFGTVTWGSVRKGNDRAKRAMSWRPTEAKHTTQTV